MIILKNPKIDKLFINLNKEEYEEKNFTKEQISQKFVSGLGKIVEIFDNHNNSYQEKAKKEVSTNNIIDEKDFLNNLLQTSKLLKKILLKPLDKSNYKTLIETQDWLNWHYFEYQDDYCSSPYEQNRMNIEFERHMYVNGLDSDFYYKPNQTVYKRMIEEDEKFSCFKSIELLKYGQFLYVMSAHIYCYLCLYYENLNKKYYFRFEALSDYYNYTYFTMRENVYLLKLDKKLYEYLDYCNSLESLIKKWVGGNEGNK